MRSLLVVGCVLFAFISGCSGCGTGMRPGSDGGQRDSGGRDTGGGIDSGPGDGCGAPGQVCCSPPEDECDDPEEAACDEATDRCLVCGGAFQIECADGCDPGLSPVGGRCMDEM